MRINAISTSTNFKGLFTNKTAQNGNNWLMEYQPYSWEKKSPDEFGMAPKRTIDINATDLPDNEEIYKVTDYRASSKDILGTESYYVNKINGSMRRQITEAPALSREESLAVKNKKLAKFLDTKKHFMEEQADYIMSGKNQLETSKSNYRKYSDDVKQGYFGRSYSLETSHREMDKEYKYVSNYANSMQDAFEKYSKMRDSADAVKDLIAKNAEEIKNLKSLGESGLLVDISRRDIYDPNKVLWNALQNIKTASKKFVALPHKLISVEEILAAIGSKVKTADIPTEAIKYVDKLINRIYI